ncbi:jg15214 [Pararge aegeria aegeria]|uniref:Jg15214 protein n=1 Tax=Pararge aegeria aegeria TaxID=348720 RepID=A0A8S4QGR1_9NEOP|nr:jg15214 [Pararge aegeria aegeria]
MNTFWQAHRMARPPHVVVMCTLGSRSKGYGRARVYPRRPEPEVVTRRLRGPPPSPPEQGRRIVPDPDCARNIF